MFHIQTIGNRRDEISLSANSPYHCIHINNYTKIARITPMKVYVSCTLWMELEGKAVGRGVE